MSFLDFCQLILITLGVWIVATLVLSLSKDTRDFCDNLFPVIGVIGIIILAIANVFCWIIFVTAYNDRNIDEQRCASLGAPRGHVTQFFNYNLFNHECYIKVDGQWVEVNDDNRKDFLR